MGTEFRQDAFRVACGTLIQYNAFADAPTCTEAPLSFGGGALAMGGLLRKPGVGGADCAVENP